MVKESKSTVAIPLQYQPNILYTVDADKLGRSYSSVNDNQFYVWIVQFQDHKIQSKVDENENKTKKRKIEGKPKRTTNTVWFYDEKQMRRKCKAHQQHHCQQQQPHQHQQWTNEQNHFFFKRITQLFPFDI